jgi:hypothetical protein
VLIGALLGAIFVRTTPGTLTLGIFAVLVVSGAGATRGSRWNVTPLFGTALVLTLLLYRDPEAAAVRFRFNQRVGETILGVAVAYVFGEIVPSLLQRMNR